MSKKILWFTQILLLAATMVLILSSLNCTYKDWQFWALWYCIFLIKAVAKPAITKFKHLNAAQTLAHCIWLLTFFLVVLKLQNIIAWSWAWVLYPLWGSVICGVILLVITDRLCKYYKKEGESKTKE